MGETEPTPRQLFADRLSELLELAADRPIKNMVAEANRRRPAGRGRPVSGRRVSDWKRGRHLPESEVAFITLIRVLIEHCRGRRVLPERVSPGLLDEEQWREWLRAARNSPPDPEHDAGPSDPSQEPENCGRWATECPYRGLASFEWSQAEVFYGREKLTMQLVDALADRLDRPGILVVSGASGAGKSSLLRAGLLPALAGGALSAESAAWPIAVMQPTSQPRDELARALAKVAGRDPATIRKALEAAPQRAEAVVRDVVDAHASAAESVAASTEERLILAVDQFEQTFTLHDGPHAPAERQRTDFIAALSAMATSPCGPGGEPAALVIAVIRSDFLSACAAHPELADAVKAGLFLVGPMTPQQLRLTITGPAERAGLHIDPALVDTILADLPASALDGGYEVGALPLLSEAMRVTWAHREDHRLTSRGYERSGGVVHAIQTSAETVYTALTPAQQTTARQVFHRLTKVTTDGRATRRPMPYGGRQFDPDQPETPTPAAVRNSGQPSEVTHVVEAFAAQRLITVDEGTAQITHDTLLHAWGRLRGWLEDDPTNRALYSQLADDAAEWARNHHPSYLYRGERLAAVLSAQQHWNTDPNRYPPLSQDEQDFLHSGVKVESRNTRRRRALTTALSVLLILALVASTVAVRTQRGAIHQRDMAASRQLAAQSENLATAPDISALLAATAWRIKRTPEARAALLTALSRPYRGSLTGHTEPVNAVAFSPDGHTLATGTSGDDDSNGTLRFWDVKTRNQIGKPLPQRVSSVTFSPDGHTLAAGGDENPESAKGVDDLEGVVWLWDVAAHRQIGKILTGPNGPVASVVFSRDGKTLATFHRGDNGGVSLWDVTTRHRIGKPFTGSSNSVAFSRDLQTLATSSGINGVVRLWDATTHRQIGKALTKGVSSVAFSPDGKELATTTEKGTVILWDVTTRRRIGQPLTYRSEPENWGSEPIAFSPDGRILASDRGDGVVLWNLAAHQPLGEPLTGPSSGTHSIAFSPDGRTLATGSPEGSGPAVDTVQFWDISNRRQIGRPLSTLIGGVSSMAAFSRDRRTIAIGGYKGDKDQTIFDDRNSLDGMVWFWDTTTHRRIGKPMSIPGGPVRSIALSPDGHTLAAISNDGMLRLMDVTTHRQVGKSITSTSGELVSTEFSPDGHSLATGIYDEIRGEVRLWDLTTRRQVGRFFTSASGEVLTIRFSFDGQLLAAIGDDANAAVWVWNIANHQQTGTRLTGGGSLAFSPDGKTLATASGYDEYTALLWDTTTRRQIGLPLDHTSSVFSVAFSLDGHLLATAESKARTIRIWDVATHRQIGRPLSTPIGSIDSIAFGPDDQTLITTHRSREAVLFWDVSMPVDLVSAACSIAGRTLTRAEWDRYVAAGARFRNVCP